MVGTPPERCQFRDICKPAWAPRSLNYSLTQHRWHGSWSGGPVPGVGVWARSLEPCHGTFYSGLMEPASHPQAPRTGLGLGFSLPRL